MSIPIFNVPNAPGVPSMVRSSLTSVSNVEGLVAGIQTTIQFFQGQPPLPTWGIFDSNFNSVVDADSFMSFNHRKEATIPTFQVQDGQLAAYNKVQLPGNESIRITKGGSQADRANLIRQLDSLQASLDNFTIVTPEKSYLNRNCYTYDLVRKDKDDAFFFSDVELILQEVPTTNTTYTTTTTTSTANAQQPSAQPQVGQGVLQSSAVSPAAQSQAIATLGGTLP